MDLLLDVHLITDLGLGRERNEDRCGAFTPEDAATRLERGRLFVVADGMGGHAGGDVAAEMTVEAVPEHYFRGTWSGPGETLRQAFIAANSAIERRAVAEPQHFGMGAAAVAAAVVGDRAFVVHLGDCRAYSVRDNAARRLTVDHSWVHERVAAGVLTEDEARVHHQRNFLTRALGAERDADPTLDEVEFLPGDALILCSDGLWDLVDGDELAGMLARADDARSAARALVELALERGGQDNISVAVVRALAPDDGAALPGDGARP